ncbi:MAG: hypothetical protein ACR2RB_16565 [Gammaproteobacteria bacterium]
MKLIVYLLLISLFVTEYIAGLAGSAGRAIAWVPEMLSLAALILIVLRVIATKQFLVHPKYVVFFALFVLHVIAGVILNAVQPGAIVQGLRVYLKFFPFFLLPAVYLFSDQEMKNQLRLILLLAVLQFPIVIYQRFVLSAGLETGDYVVGSLGVSSILSIFLISTVAVLLPFLLNRRLNPILFVVLLFLLLAPTTLNETKGSFFLLPFAFVVPAIAFAAARRRIMIVLPVLAAGTLLMAAFLSVYNLSLGWREQGRSLTEFLDDKKFIEYLYRESEGNKAFMEKAVEDEVGRIDSYILAWKTLSRDFSKLLLGLGIGNVGPSFSRYLKGEYSERYAHLGPKISSISYLMWEVGLIGLALSLLGCYLVFGDARRLAFAPGVAGTFAQGWLAVVVIYVLSLAYKNILGFNVIGYLFWYFSGYVAVNALQWRMQPAPEREPPAPAVATSH